jgi:hypothetical protein
VRQVADRRQDYPSKDHDQRTKPHHDSADARFQARFDLAQFRPDRGNIGLECCFNVLQVLLGGDIVLVASKISVAIRWAF